MKYCDHPRVRLRTLVLRMLNFGLSVLFLTSVDAFAQTTVKPQAPQNQPQNTSSSEPPTIGDDRYRIGPDDVIEVRVFNRPQLSRDAVRVDGRGMIRMPLIEDDVFAACLTEAELSQKLQKEYREYLINPQIDVFVKEFNSNPVTVVGAVSKPGRFQLQRRVRLMELITIAGGPTPTAGRYLQIFRSPERLKCSETNTQGSDDDVTKGLISVELTQLFKGSEGSNPYLQPGDIVSVPEGEQVFVVGNVYKPSTIPLREPITMSYAIALAGGMLEDSKTDKVRIIRQNPGSPTKTAIIVNMHAVGRKGADDPMLQAGDIVEVPVSSGARFKKFLTYTLAPALVYAPANILR